ncbi:MAG: LicD family protein [Clostridiales bacterium]|nr:LicD family protein [Clostridiales bacterium]
MYNYMNPDTQDNWKIKKLQDKILDIAVYVDLFCTENNINYCLMGGSALGAVRHAGFIPWDDDIDFFMTPDNYEKFVELFKKKGDHTRFFLEPFGQFDNMVTLGKVRAKNTTYIEESLMDYKISHCIYLDIFILHTCPDNILKRIHQYVWAKYIIVKSQAYKDISRYGFGLKIILLMFRLLPRLFLIKYALKQVYRYRDKKTKLFCNYLGKAKFKRGTYKREWFDSTKRIPFETVSLSVPDGVEEFLSERFGDYMKIPNNQQIKREQHASIWDTERNYTEYLEKEPKLPAKYIF